LSEQGPPADLGFTLAAIHSYWDAFGFSRSRLRSSFSLWVGKERTIESFQGFFTAMGQEVTSKISFICSDMWEPYLKLIREKCSEALHILDRFHIVANMNKALDNR
jgi:transposase